MTTKEFHDKVLDRFTNNITDRVFLMIQNDPELKVDYQKLIEGLEREDVRSMNIQIAKAIKKKYTLESNGENKNPESNLIESYTRFL
jgi:hypothetical protein